MLPSPSAALLASLIPAGGICAPVPEEAHAAAAAPLERAQQALVASDWENAETALREALRFDPGRPLAHYGLGQALLAGGRAAEAAEAFRASREAFRCALSDDPEERRAREAALQREIVRLRDALREIERRDIVENAIPGQQVNSHRARPGRGDQMRRAREMEMRLEQLQSALGAGDPVPAFVSYALGTALIQAGNLPGAERELRAALAAEPDSGDGHNNLAVVLMLTGRLEEAESEAHRAEELGIPVNPRLFEEIRRRREAR